MLLHVYGEIKHNIAAPATSHCVPCDNSIGIPESLSQISALLLPMEVMLGTLRPQSCLTRVGMTNS